MLFVKHLRACAERIQNDAGPIHGVTRIAEIATLDSTLDSRFGVKAGLCTLASLTRPRTNNSQI